MYFRHITRSHTQPRGGFTLTEMLVATGLVVLIMLMFAQIFGTAVGTMTEQRGLANNDQKARIISSVIRSDLQNMTYRQPAMPYGNVQGIVALAPGDEPIIDPINQRGYFYYSENVANDDTDDLIQFTVMLGNNGRGNAGSKDSQLFVGKAGNLSVDNEPEQDDGINGDTKGISRAAEVVYFLRRGNLYRRVLLIRDPLSRSTKADTQPSNPTNGNRVFQSPSNINYSGQFLRDFDYSATRRAGSGLWFHSIESLDNTQGIINFPLGRPALRFGFKPIAFTGSGESVEFDNDNMGTYFGRFTKEETSHGDFGFPGRSPGPPVTNHPLIRNNLSLNSDGVISVYAGGPDQGEDILMNNVESFDVEIVDDSTLLSGAFGDVAGGFDSWHPTAGTVTPARRFLNTTGVVTWTPSAARSVNDVIRVPSLQSSTNNSLRYIVITTTGSGNSGTKAPEFPAIPGTIVQDNEVTWQCIDNRIGVKGVKLTIRYRDVQSNLPRQVTIVHSFVD